MKRWIGAVMVVVLLVSVAPVLAGDSFYALSRLAGLSPLDDAQLAAVEGGQVDYQSIVAYESTQGAHQSISMDNIAPDTTGAVSLEEVAAVGEVAAVQVFGEGWLQAILRGEVAAVQAFGEGWLQR